MAIVITNDIYEAIVASLGAGEQLNRPLIGWRSLFAPADLSATVSADGFPALAMWSPDTYTRWKTPTIGASQETPKITIQKTGAGNADYIGIAGHNFYETGTSYQVVRIDGVTETVITAPVVPTDNRPIFIYFNSSSDSVYEIRLVIPANSDPVYISHVKLGRILQLERAVWSGETPAGMDIRVESIGSKSYAGQYLGSVLISEGEAFNITQQNNSASFVRSTALQDFFKHAHQLIKLDLGAAESFFYAWRPDTHPTEVQYCGKINNFSPPSNQIGTTTGGLMKWSISGDAFK